MLIPESPQALSKVRHDWLEMAAVGNLGAPVAMTKLVANCRTSSIQAHVLNGPCAKPDAERTFDFISRERPAMSLLQNVGIQTADYIRRRTEFETYAYKSGNDSLCGRMQDRMRRDEN